MKKITCVVDNKVQPSSFLRGEHGMSFWIQMDDNHVLFDTGMSGTVLLHNLKLLELNVQEIGGVILSHAHHDHTGGLSNLLSEKLGTPLYASPDLFRPRYSIRNQQYKSIGLSMTEDELSQLAELRLDDSPIEIVPGLWTSGEIDERAEPEGRSAQHVVQADDGWMLDPYQDDMSMVMETQDGLVLICGCCHAGLINTMSHVTRTFQRPIIAVLGGTHLVTADEPYLKQVVSQLRDFHDLQSYYLNHCTGENAFQALANVFGERVKPCPAGTIVTF
jgi:7,8-dihydropterin-6-yl-methyl-4-(beta-D-ribofuranosyl)aminobenzene 5'-phosphate synthase